MVSATRQIALLVVLYIIQGIPLGISAAIPLILQTRGVSYKAIAKFSIAALPFSLKLLWAPIVDSTRFPGVGRRKSWLIPTQLICGLVMLLLGGSGEASAWIGEPQITEANSSIINNDTATTGIFATTSSTINVTGLTAMFLLTNLLMATQDIAVDGWALEILPLHLKKHASTCNTIGQIIGVFLSNGGFLLLNDPRFCNKYLRSVPQPYGLASLGGFLRFWGIVILVVTCYVAIFESERGQKISVRIYRRGSSVSGSNSSLTCTPEKTASPASVDEDHPHQDGARREAMMAKSVLKETEMRCLNHKVDVREGITLFSPSNGEVSSGAPIVTGVKLPGSEGSALLGKSTNTGTNCFFTSGYCTDEGNVESPESVRESYGLLCSLAKIKVVQLAGLVLLTCRIPFGSIEGSSALKLVEAGLRKEELAVMFPLVLPWNILTAFIVGKMIGKWKPLQIFKTAMICRLPIILLWCGLFGYIRIVRGGGQSHNTAGESAELLVDLLTYTIMVLQAIVSESMFVSQMAFFAEISDTAVGGTYMTFLNTVTNLGNKWPAMLSLYLLENSSVIGIDGFIVQSAVCCLLGLIWLSCGGSWALNRLQTAGLLEWKLSVNSSLQPPSSEYHRVGKRRLSDNDVANCSYKDDMENLREEPSSLSRRQPRDR